MTLALSSFPGLSDLKDASLAADKPALGVHLNRINQNANFGIVRLEIFSGTYRHGETIPVPTSDVDGYIYNRKELMYLWSAQNTGDPNTGWASYREPWTMWYGVWNVNQTTGEVSSQIGYRGNQDHLDRQAQTNDGLLQVFVIAQRQLVGLHLSAAPAFNKIPFSSFYTDAPLKTSLLTKMNGNAKQAVVNSEIIYMGEFGHGESFTPPVSPIDGYAYSIGEVAVMSSFRWTSETANGGPVVPALSKGQLQDWSSTFGVSGSTTTVSLAIAYESNGRHTYNEGKIAVWLFCSRSFAGVTLDEVETNFAEMLQDVLMPGQTLRASTMAQLNSNINQALLTPEFFGATSYSNGATIPLPTSPIDGYTYARNELFYIWDVAATGPSTHTGDRMSLFQAGISSGGVVTVNDYRLQDGASLSSLAHEGQLRVIVYGKRTIHPTHPPIVPVNQPTDPVNDFTQQTIVSAVLNQPGTAIAGDSAITTLYWPNPFRDALYAVTALSIVGGNGEGVVSVVGQTATTVDIEMDNIDNVQADASVTVTGGY